MRILQVITRNELRGAEVFVGLLSQTLAARGHDVCIAALYAPTTRSHPLAVDEDVRVVELNGRVKGRIEAATSYRLLRTVGEFRPDVVQANAFHAMKYLVLTKRLTGAGWPIVYRNVSMASGWIDKSWKRRWGTWLFRHVERVATVSDRSRLDLCQAYRFPETRATTIRRGIRIADQVQRDAARCRLAELAPVDTNRPILFHVGGFSREKNHAGLVVAFQQILQDHPDAQLVLCGDGPLRSDIDQTVEAAGMSSHVFILGNRGDAAELIAGADVLLLPSHIEGIPGVVLEAAAQEVPAVCTNVGAVAEAVIYGETGILVPAGDMIALGQAASRLISDTAVRERMGSAARDLVARQHNLEQTTTQFKTLYADALRSRRAVA